MSKNKADSSLGRAVIKDRFSKKKTHGNDTFLHTTDLEPNKDWCTLPVRSLTEENNLTEFFHLADLAGAQYDAERRNMVLATGDEVVGVLSAAEKRKAEEVQKENVALLKIPRRPKWTTDMAADELAALERDTFLNWRRQLAQLEAVEHVMLTPFEKNLDFWRQLWRVVERSDVVVQIVDARNPLLFRCHDLDEYVLEVDKEKVNVLLINKADLLTEKQRATWAAYFESIGVRALFWSAKLAEKENDEREAAEKRKAEGEDNVMEEDEVEGDDAVEEKEDVECAMEESEHPVEEDATTEGPGSLSSVDNLINLLKAAHVGTKAKEGITTIGLVGYPNVGKSSTLNAIFREKKTAVSATPGRTKHFQTLFISEDLLVCDCPGLVMPSFVYSKADLIVSGVLSIDHMRDCLPPIQLVCEQIPRSSLECMYGITVPPPKEGEDPHRPPNARELLAAFGYMHGLMSTKGTPHLDRAARIILKDYVSGRLLYRHPPPGVEPLEFESAGQPPPAKMERWAAAEQRRADREKKNDVTPFDRAYFCKTEAGSGIRGRVTPGIGNTQLTSGPIAPGDKPWRRHHNKKKDKLRRIHAHLDKHE